MELGKFIKKLFYFRDLDSHYIINILGFQIKIKHKSIFCFKEVSSYGLNKEKRQREIVVSLGSYPKRIETVSYTINTLLRQSLKPDKVILWLSEDEFPNKTNDLPEKLISLIEYGLEIRWCENLRSYKKIVPALREFPDSIIVTADDDLYYESDWLKSLYEEYLNDSSNIYVRRAVRVKVDGQNIKKISDRKLNYVTPKDTSYFNQLLSGSGCLFPPNSLYADIMDTNKFMKILPTQDDIFLWAMAVLNRTKTKVVKGYDATFYYVEGTQDDGLCKINKKSGGGIDAQDGYKRISEEYPTILEILTENQ